MFDFQNLYREKSKMGGLRNSSKWVGRSNIEENVMSMYTHETILINPTKKRGPI